MRRQSSAVPTDARGMALAITTMAACALPLFFTSALALSIQRDLRLADEQIGLAIAAFWVLATLGSLPGGWLVDRIGAARGVHLAGACVGAGSLAIALVADSFAAFAALLALTGLGNAIIAPGMSAVVSRSLRAGRHGTTFGLQQSGPPLASVVAGIALPTAGAALGWRWVFALGAVAAVAATGIVRDADAASLERPAAGPAPGRRGPSRLLVLGGALASGAANGLLAYLVVFSVAAGLSTAAAGILLALASITCVATRIGLGVLADRRPAPRLPQMAGLALAGVAGFGLLAVEAPWTTVAGCTLALGVGWGWAGLYVLTAVEQGRAAPGRAVGAAATGTFAGAMVGPPLVGLLSAGASFAFAWLVCGALSLVAAWAFLGARQLRPGT
jgi:MFS family permease